MNNVIIIPSLNPNEKIIRLIKELKNLKLNNIIVIDDGSPKQFQFIFDQLEKLNVHVFHHERNLGKGKAIKTGIKMANICFPDANGYITADADYQHLPKDILNVSLALDNNQNSIILGTRTFGKEVPFKSKFGNKFSSIFFKLKTNVTCEDTQTGLRGIPVRFFNFALNTPGSRYEYEMNFLIDVALKKIPFVIVPIETVYENNNKGSHFHTIRDSILIYKKPLKFVISSIISAFVDLFIFNFIIETKFINFSFLVLSATVIARCISGIVNFTLNKKWSFESKGKTEIEAIKYLILFIVQMFLSSLLVLKLSIIKINIVLIKIMVDSILFIINYMIQKKYIFRGDKH